MNTGLPSNIQAIVDKVEKLLRLAANNSNEAEAASAAAMAMKLLAAYNLDMAVVGQKGGQTDRRDDKRMGGGLYKWQRLLWNEVAQLNFCMYWSIRGLQKGSKYEHRVLGRTANILSTRLMAEYLEQAIERITRERFDNDPARYFSKDGVAYREGMADRIGERLRQRRREAEREAEAKKAEDRARNPGSANALTIVDVRRSEKEANEEFEYDLHHGPGAWLRVKKEQEQWLQGMRSRQAEAEKAAQQFRDEHPEEYARLEAQARAEYDRAEREEAVRQRRNSRRRQNTGPRFTKSDYPRSDTYWERRDKGGDVSLDRQVDRDQQKKISDARMGHD